MSEPWTFVWGKKGENALRKSRISSSLWGGESLHFKTTIFGNWSFLWLFLNGEFMAIALECMFFSYLYAISLLQKTHSHQGNCFGANFQKIGLKLPQGYFGSMDNTEPWLGSAGDSIFYSVHIPSCLYIKWELWTVGCQSTMVFTGRLNILHSYFLSLFH
jgi:hypothetical protein